MLGELGEDLVGAIYSLGDFPVAALEETQEVFDDLIGEERHLFVTVDLIRVGFWVSEPFQNDLKED